VVRDPEAQRIESKNLISIYLDSNDPVKDLSHVLDFLCHVKYVQVCCQNLGNKIKQNMLWIFFRLLEVPIILVQVL
jgi:hypothetical protein